MQFGGNTPKFNNPFMSKQQTSKNSSQIMKESNNSSNNSITSPFSQSEYSFNQTNNFQHTISKPLQSQNLISNPRKNSPPLGAKINPFKSKVFINTPPFSPRPIIMLIFNFLYNMNIHYILLRLPRLMKLKWIQSNRYIISTPIIYYFLSPTL